MITKIVSKGSKLPVSIEETKDYLRIEYDIEDAVVQAQILASLNLAESMTKRSLIETNYIGYLDSFPASTNTVIKLPYPPLSTVSSNVVVTYVKDDTAGSSTTWDATAYVVDWVSQPARIYPAYENSYPTNVRLQRNAVQIAFKSGYSESAFPEPIKSWIKLRVSAGLEYRTPIVEGKTIEVIKKDYVDGLLDPYIFPEVV